MKGDVSSIGRAKLARIIRDQRPVVSLDEPQEFPVLTTEQAEVSHRHRFITAGPGCRDQIGREVFVDQKTGPGHIPITPAG